MNCIYFHKAGVKCFHVALKDCTFIAGIWVFVSPSFTAIHCQIIFSFTARSCTAYALFVCPGDWRNTSANYIHVTSVCSRFGRLLMHQSCFSTSNGITEGNCDWLGKTTGHTPLYKFSPDRKAIGTTLFGFSLHNRIRSKSRVVVVVYRSECGDCMASLIPRPIMITLDDAIASQSENMMHS